MTPIIVYTLEQYTVLSEAIATGALEVKYGDKTVKYRTLDEMIRILKIMTDQLFPSQNKNNGRVYSSFSKGVDCRHRNEY